MRPSACKTLVCLSHLRWDFVYQRPQHVMVRAAQAFEVYYLEEPRVGGGDEPRLVMREEESGRIKVAVPEFPEGLSHVEHEAALALVFQELLAHTGHRDVAVWYYTPSALRFSRWFQPALTIYDCMDELTLFKGADPSLKRFELELFSRADVVFTGGASLYRAKRALHPNVHCYPSSIEFEHFAQAREKLADPPDQSAVPRPRVGFYGVVDERFDIDLLASVSALRPDWSFVIIGPTAKIEASKLPQAPNIHYLGMKRYEELPAYLANWDVAALLFARNDATKFISPTKTPEYLAGGKPVISTSITDVVTPYGDKGLVQICDDGEAFSAALDKALLQARNPLWLEAVDLHVRELSWDKTWGSMFEQICGLETKSPSKRLFSAVDAPQMRGSSASKAS